MPILYARQTGNLTASATWGLVSNSNDPGNASVSLQALTTSYVAGTAFTPGAITVDGIAVKLGSRIGAPAGTISVALDQGGATVAGTEVTLNVSDLDAAAVAGDATYPGGGGWYFFKFAAPVTLAAATAYAVKAKGSVASEAQLVINGANHWAYQVRTTTQQAPANGDTIIVGGEFTGAGAGASFTVTMDNTASLNLQDVHVCKRGTLAVGTAGSTAYLLRFCSTGANGWFVVWPGGTFTAGTVATPMPATSSFTLQSLSGGSASGMFDVRHNGTVVMQGASKTTKALLAASAAAGATSITTDVSTGWAAGDEIVIAPTSRTATQYEFRILGSPAVGASVPVTGLSFAHDVGGNPATRCEVICITRNVRVMGQGPNQSLAFRAWDAQVDVDYVEFKWMASTTGLQLRTYNSGVAVGGGYGNLNFQYCSLHSSGLGFMITPQVSPVTVAHCVTYGNSNVHLNIAVTGSAACAVDDVWGIYVNGTSAVFGNSSPTASLTNCVAVGGGTSGGFTFGSLANLALTSNLVAHSNAGAGVTFTFTAPTLVSTLLSVASWRNNSYGVVFDGARNIALDGGAVFGNLNANVRAQSTASLNVTLRNLALDGDASFATATGLDLSAQNVINMALESCTLGATVAHSSQDVNCATVNMFVGAVCFNTLFNSATEINGLSNLLASSYVRSQKHDQTAGNHRSWFREGQTSRDSVVYDVPPSMRLAPSSATEKLTHYFVRVPVPSGGSVQVTVKVRKSVAGDGAAYAGNQPRVLVERNPAAGVAANTVLATAASIAGVWETLTVTSPAVTDDCVLTFLIDCDGTVGFINVDTIGVQ